MKKLMAVLLVAGLMVGGVLGAVLAPHAIQTAEAQTVSGLPGPPTTGTGIGDAYSGKNEVTQCWTGTLSTTAVGVICTALNTTTRTSIKSMRITCTTAQYVDLYDGATQGPGSTILAHFYCRALTPENFSRDDLGTGWTTAIGDGISILGGNTGACAIVYTVQHPTQ